MLFKYVVFACLIVGSQAQACTPDVCGTPDPAGLKNGLPCHCDEQCVDWEDCCDGYDGVCVNRPVSDMGPLGQCEGDCFNAEAGQFDAMTGASCFCDPECVGYGDCCYGYQDACSGDQPIKLHSDAEESVYQIELAFQQFVESPETLGDQCMNSCERTDQLTDPVTGGACYCDALCTQQSPPDCCPGYNDQCAYPELVQAMHDAFEVSSAKEDVMFCSEIAVISGNSCGNWYECADSEDLCDTVDQRACDNGVRGFPAGWFHWKCPQACGLCTDTMRMAAVESWAMSL